MKDSPKINRRFSHSAVSETTVGSSVVVSTIENNGENSQEFGGPTQNNVKIESSSGIRVGDVIYNIYSPSPPAEIFENLNKSRVNPTEFQTNSNVDTSAPKDASEQTSQSSEELSSPQKKFGINLNCKFKKKKILIILILFSLIIAITFLIYFFVIKSVNDNFDIISRSEWTKYPPSGSKLLKIPIKRILVGQTDDSELCFIKEECIQRIKAIDAKNPHLKDVPWNFLIGADGNVYEGCGYQYEGEHTMDVNSSNYNDIGIGIGFIGNFSLTFLPSQMIQAFKKFITKSINDNLITSDHLIIFQDQLVYKEIYADMLGGALKEMENFYDFKKIYSRKEWGAYDSCNFLTLMPGPLTRVIIHHSGENTWQCPDFYNCTEELKLFQKNNMVNCKMFDTYYNFAIGGMGSYSIVMEVRGFSKLGAHTKDYNNGSLGIGLIGDYDRETPGSAMMEALTQFIDDSVALGKLTEDYELHIKRDYDGASSPGTNVINILKNWPHFKTATKN